VVDLKFEEPVTEEVDVDDETLAAIVRGLEDAKAGRTVSIEDVQNRLPQWISNSHSRSQR
jgi:predicted transcriptional regulator